MAAASPTITERAAMFIALGFGSGLAKPAPGTWGSAFGLASGYGLVILGVPALGLGIAVSSLAGIWSAGVYERVTGRSDAGEVVIDEIAGQWIALLPIALLAGPAPWWTWLAAFALFRAFDILKPGPIGWLDRRVKGGLGVMLDDLLAGVLAALCLQGLILYVA